MTLTTLLPNNSPLRGSPILTRSVAFLTFYLGTAHLVHYNFLLATGTLVDQDVFPGRNWLFILPRTGSLFFPMAFAFCAICIHKIPYGVAIFWSSLGMALTSAWYLGAVMLAPDTSWGFYMAVTSSGLNLLFAAITRSKYLGVLYNLGFQVPWVESLGLAFSGLMSGLITSATYLTGCGMRTTIFISTIAAIVTQMGNAMTYKGVKRLSAEVFTFTASKNEKKRDDSQKSKKSSKYTSIGAAGTPTSGFRYPCHYNSVQLSYGGKKSTAAPRDFSLNPRPFGQILRAASCDLFNCFAVLLITFVVFPGVALSWRTPEGWSSDAYGLYLIMLFQTSDFASRLFALFRLPRKTVVFAALARIAFIPLFFACRAYPDDRVFGSLPFQSVAMLLFGASNGYVFAVAYIYGTSQVVHPSEVISLGPCVAFASQLGVLVGSYISWAKSMADYYAVN